MPYIVPKLHFAYSLLTQSAIFFAAAPVLSAVLSFARSLARCELRSFAKRAGFISVS
jgi:hypothetical protein